MGRRRAHWIQQFGEWFFVGPGDPRVREPVGGAYSSGTCVYEAAIPDESSGGATDMSKHTLKHFPPRATTAFKPFFDAIDAAEIRREAALDRVERAVARLPEELPEELRRAAFVLLAKPIWNEFREAQTAARRVMK